VVFYKINIWLLHDFVAILWLFFKIFFYEIFLWLFGYFGAIFGHFWSFFHQFHQTFFQTYALAKNFHLGTLSIKIN
jgi:hypothetical protein